MAQEPNADQGAQTRPSGDDRRDKRGSGGKKHPKGKGRPRKDRPPRGSSPLKAGLFASVADKDVPCRVEDCANTWAWSGVDQMKNLGQPTPQRMCDDHLAEFNQLEDREIECRNPSCSNTWTWKRGTQLHQLQKHEKLKTPSRLCTTCFDQEKNVADVQVHCKIGGCKRSWNWTRDAQVKHRAWLRRLQAKIQAEEEAERRAEESERVPAEAKAASTPERATAEPAPANSDAAAETEQTEAATSTESPAPSEGPGESPEQEVSTREADGGEKRKRKRKRKRRRKRKLPEGPPEKMCSPCAAHIAQIEPIEQPCKVHGCVRTWTWSKEHQLRAWAGLGTDDHAKKPATPRRMCTTCRDFCREHPDKQVPCGRPGCDKSWAWKTGAQLQAHLAGKNQDPIRLCDHCAKGEFLLTRPADGSLPPGAEVMPCVVPACDGNWTYLPGMQLMGAREGEAPPDRMCDKCRTERGLEARAKPGAADPTASPAESEPQPQEDGIPSEENSAENSAPIAAEESVPPEEQAAATADESGEAPQAEGDGESTQPDPDPAAPSDG